MQNRAKNKAIEYVKAIRKENKWLGEMDELVEKIDASPSIAVAYNYVIRLSVYQVNLGQLVAKLVRRSNAAYAYRKYKYADEWTSLSMAGNKRDMEAEKLIYDNRVDEIAVRYVADMLKAKHDDISGLIMAVQSGARIEDRDRFTAR